MIISGMKAIKVQDITWLKPDNSRNCAPTAIVFEMMQTATSHRIKANIWKANEMRKKRTNFFDRWRLIRLDLDVKWDAISKMGDWTKKTVKNGVAENGVDHFVRTN